MAHTPGPWSIFSQNYPANPKNKRGVLAAGINIQGDGPSTFVAYCDHLSVDDLQLMSAAPELLDLAIQYARDLIRPPAEDSRKRRLEQIERVLRKATGNVETAAND